MTIKDLAGVAMWLIAVGGPPVEQPLLVVTRIKCVMSDY